MSNFQVTGLPTIPQPNTIQLSLAPGVPLISNLPSIPTLSNTAPVSVSNLPSIPTLSNTASAPAPAPVPVTATDNTGTPMWIFWVGIAVLLIAVYLMMQKK